MNGAPRHSPVAGAGEWDAFLEEAPGAGIYHSEVWAHVLGLTGWATRVVSVRSGGSIAAGCLLAVKSIPALGRRVAFAPRGVVLARGAGEDALAALLEALRTAAREERALFVRLGAPVPRARDGQPVEAGLRLIESFRKLGCRYEEGSDWSTFCIELDRSGDELLAQMSVNARRDMRSGEKHGVVVAEGNAPADIERFYRMHAGLYRMKGLTVAPEALFAHGARTLVERGRATIFWATKEGEPLNAALVSLVGVPRFLWGARDVSPSASRVQSGHLLHFRIMQALRARGKKHYDLGGSPAHDLAPDHPNYGVWRFKKSLGGRHLDFVQDVSLVLSPALTALHDGLMPLYRRLFAVSPFYRKKEGA
jgi:lipid II:glycine glycyltransferase (peptidoglycan interpeptide bridge formation enzyme)